MYDCYLCVCVCASMYVTMCVCMHVRTYAYTCAYCVCMKYTHTHTKHIRTRTHTQLTTGTVSLSHCSEASMATACSLSTLTFGATVRWVTRGCLCMCAGVITVRIKMIQIVMVCENFAVLPEAACVCAGVRYKMCLCAYRICRCKYVWIYV